MMIIFFQWHEAQNYLASRKMATIYYETSLHKYALISNSSIVNAPQKPVLHRDEIDVKASM